MSYFSDLRVSAETDGAKYADDLLESMAETFGRAWRVDSITDEQLEQAFMHTVRLGASLGAVVIATASEGRLSQRRRTAQLCVSLVSAGILREIRTRDEELVRNPQVADELLGRAKELYPSLFEDPRYLYESGLEMEPGGGAGPLDVLLWSELDQPNLY